MESSKAPRKKAGNFPSIEAAPLLTGLHRPSHRVPRGRRASDERSCRGSVAECFESRGCWRQREQAGGSGTADADASPTCFQVTPQRERERERDGSPQPLELHRRCIVNLNPFDLATFARLE